MRGVELIEEVNGRVGGYVVVAMFEDVILA
jgi:hypothetical protein